MFEWFGFANSFKWITFDLFYEIVYLLEDFPVSFLPVKVILPSIIGKYEFNPKALFRPLAPLRAEGGYRGHPISSNIIPISSGKRKGFQEKLGQADSSHSPAPSDSFYADPDHSWDAYIHA